MKMDVQAHDQASAASDTIPVRAWITSWVCPAVVEHPLVPIGGIVQVKKCLHCSISHTSAQRESHTRALLCALALSCAVALSRGLACRAPSKMTSDALGIYDGGVRCRGCTGGGGLARSRSLDAMLRGVMVDVAVVAIKCTAMTKANKKYKQRQLGLAAQHRRLWSA